VTTSQFEDQEGRDLVEAIHARKAVFDYDAPLPPMPDYRARSWEPAARHYRDLDEDEKERA
jgi:hypothetical protein